MPASNPLVTTGRRPHREIAGTVPVFYHHADFGAKVKNHYIRRQLSAPTGQSPHSRRHRSRR